MLGAQESLTKLNGPRLLVTCDHEEKEARESVRSGVVGDAQNGVSVGRQNNVVTLLA